MMHQIHASKKASVLMQLALALCLSFAVAPHVVSAASDAACAAYATYFPYAQTTTECIMTNMCYTRTYCCAAAGQTDLSLCLDITSFTCNLTSACEAHASDSSWYPFTLNSGMSVSCCQDGYTTTPAPAVPNFDVSASSNPTDSSHAGLLPARTCDDDNAQGCAVSSGFPSLIRGFCQSAIPASYTDAYLVQSASNMCCEYAAAPAGTTEYNALVGKAKCGMSLLDLPRVGEFHCAMVGRAATICCNGRITGASTTASAASSSASSSTAATSSAVSSTLGSNYTYISNRCLYVPKTGDAAVHESMSLGMLLVVAVIALLNAVI